MLVLAGCLAGCVSDEPTYTGGNDANVSSPLSKMTFAQVVELRSRLDKLTLDMTRDKALATINLDTFNLHPFTHTASDGSITYRIPEGHVLEIAIRPGDYDGTLRWVKFDGETWPKAYKPRPKTPPPPANN